MAYNEIGISERTYRRNKSNAFYKLAFALRLEVYEIEEQNGGDKPMSFVQPIVIESKYNKLKNI
jgi:hypothetical protein